MKICLPYPASGTFRNQWDYALCNLAPEQVFVIGDPADAPPYGCFTLDKSTWISDASELPDGTLVVLAPPTGRHIQGTENLETFTHPADAIYLFGPDSWNLSEDELDGAVADHKVFIETATSDEMYSFVAFAVVAWDRKMKAG